MYSRIPSAWFDCADYSNGTLFVSVDQYGSELHCLFIAKQVDTTQSISIDDRPDLNYLNYRVRFRMNNDSISGGLFEIDGVKFEMVTGFYDSDFFSTLGGEDSFVTPFPQQSPWDPNEYTLQIEMDYLKETLINDLCYIMFVQDLAYDREDWVAFPEIPEGFKFRVVGERINWEPEGVRIDNYRFREYGICKHKIALQTRNVADVQEAILIPEPQVKGHSTLSNLVPIAAFILILVVIVVIGTLIVKRSQKIPAPIDDD